VYDALNKAAEMASGEYVIYMNAGDYFAAPDSISQAFRFAPRDADVVYGHHYYKLENGD
jgi:5-hydroxyisourate hydrolase-like protein (transthyretin family)